MYIKDIKQNYQQSILSKPNFINQMHDSFHQILFEYAKNLKDTEIAKIEIEDNAVIMVSRPTKHHVGHVRIHCDELDKRTVPVEAFNFGSYEKEDSAMIYQLISPNDVVFDIGANIGWYTNHIAATYPSATVYAFEPIPETFQKLSGNIALNKFNNIHAYNLAFSEKEQVLKFYYSPQQTVASSSRNITENQDIIELTCDSMGIDDFVSEKNINKLDFIKCDVEGAELFIYQGAKKTIEKFKPIICTEMLRKWAAKFDYHPNDIIALFAQLGYSCFFVEKQKLVEIKEIDETTISTNFFFLHAQKHADKLKQNFR